MSVSSELRNTLEEQIGLDDIRSELRSSLSSEPRADYRQSPTSVSKVFVVADQSSHLTCCITH